MKILDSLLLVGSLTGTAVCILFIYECNKTHATPMVHAPAFKAGDCFVRNGVREAWDKPADGKVVFKGQTKYALMDESEAERKHGGDKFGFEQDIEKFDFTHRKVLCPEKWITRK